MMTIIFIILLIVSTGLISCRENKKESPLETASEYVAEVKDSDIGCDSVVGNVPVAADGSFDDFIWNFMRDKKFQYARVQFPLPEQTDGKTISRSKAQWHFDALYANESTYAIIYDSETSIGHEKEKSLKHVTVERVFLDKERVKQYLFDKIEGKWLLTGVDTHPLSDSLNGDFFTFYRRFVTDPSFQRSHIANPFEFKTYDSDTFQEIDGVLDVEQWPDFMPDMPRHVLVNLDYEQKYANSPTRVMILTSSSAGMSCTLVFKKTASSWQLTRLEDL